MPDKDTLNIPPIRGFVDKYLMKSQISIDMFSGIQRLTTYTNDLDETMPSRFHMPAEKFLIMLAYQEVKADLIIFDPPTSPRQISEVYNKVGLEVGMEGTQNGALYRRVRDAILLVTNENSIVLSFGHNTAGMGKERGFEQFDGLICCHGGAHNDTLCVAERRLPDRQGVFSFA